jgi:hypothetical protein
VRDATGTTDTLVVGDANGFVRCTNAAGCVVTVPASVFAADDVVTVIADTDGPVSIVQGAGFDLGGREGVTTIGLRDEAASVRSPGPQSTAQAVTPSPPSCRSTTSWRTSPSTRPSPTSNSLRS